MPDKRELDPMKAAWPDPDKIKCRDCFNRDKTEVKLGGKVVKCGITKSFCNAYPPPPDSNGKPLEVLFQNADCRFYAKDERAAP